MDGSATAAADNDCCGWLYGEYGSYTRRMYVFTSCRTSRSNERLMNAARIIAMFVGGFGVPLIHSSLLPHCQQELTLMMARLFLFLLLFCCLQTDDGNFCFHFAFFRVMFVYMSEKCGSLRIHSHIVVVWNMCSMKKREIEWERERSIQ